MGELTAKDVADYFLANVDEEAGDNITNLKIQKLIYYAQGFHLALNDGKPLFQERIKAWGHGPVVPELYHEFKVSGSAPLPKPADFDPSKYDEPTRFILDEVWRVYGQFSPWRLREMTHEEPPWKETATNGVIDLELMRSYFGTLIENG